MKFNSLAILTTLSISALGSAQTFTDPSGSFTAGTQNGEMFSYAGYTGLQRNSDGFDDIRPGNPRSAWGVTFTDSSGNTSSDYADQSFYGVSGVTNLVSTYGANSAFYVGGLMDGAGNMDMSITRSFSFVAPNVVGIQTTIHNLTNDSLSAMFRESFDKDPGPFYEYTNADAVTGPVTDASYYGFESPVAGAGFGADAAAGGLYGPGDLGGAFDVNLGVLGGNQVTSFTIYYGINDGTQTDASLRSQVYGLGAFYQISNFSGYTGANSVYGSTVGIGNIKAVPEPTTMTLLGLGALGLFRRRKA